MAGLHVVTLLWDANSHSQSFSNCYNETWVERLHAGFRRYLTRPFRFVCFTERFRVFSVGIDQEPLTSPEPSYASCIEPYRLNEPMILVGLDTIVTGEIDHLADYCMTADTIALPRDPYSPHRACNGVGLIPAGNAKVYEDWRGENDMEHMRRQPHVFIDDLFPGQVSSWKVRVAEHGLGDVRICYFHGHPKMHELNHVPWIREHWTAA